MLAIEVGGSSIQATLFANDGTFQIVPLSDHKQKAWAFAAPGLVDGDRVQGAHHLNWMDVLASEELGMATPPLLGMNDADASSLGEWVLQGKPRGKMFYVVMGTGIGATFVEGGQVTPVEFGHLPGFGPNFCGGASTTAWMLRSVVTHCQRRWEKQTSTTSWISCTKQLSAREFRQTTW